MSPQRPVLSLLLLPAVMSVPRRIPVSRLRFVSICNDGVSDDGKIGNGGGGGGMHARSNSYPWSLSYAVS